MAGKRKRKRPNDEPKPKNSEKRQRVTNPVKATIPKDLIIKQALLNQFYPEVLTLREYLLSRLSSASKIRRKKIVHVGSSKDTDSSANRALSFFLDRTLVGVVESKNAKKEDRWRHWGTFSQKCDDSVSTLIDLNSVGRYSQSDVRITKSLINCQVLKFPRS
jgi:telomerase reverse transcriptase